MESGQEEQHLNIRDMAEKMKGEKKNSISYTYMRQITDSLNSRDEILVQKNDVDLHVLETIWCDHFKRGQLRLYL